MPLKPFDLLESGRVTVRVEHLDYLPTELELEITPGKMTRQVLRLHRFTDTEDAAIARQYWGFGLLAGGGAVTVVAVSLFILAAESYGAYQGADVRSVSQAELDRLESETKIYLGAASATTAAGLALVTVGSYLLLFNPYAELLEEAGFTAGLAATAGGAVAAVGSTL